MMLLKRIVLLGFPLILLALPAQAQIFMCKDSNGRTISSDRPLTDCVGHIREFAKDGKIKRSIPPPLTAEQKEQKKKEEARLRAEAEALAEQKRQDRAILARYNNETEIEAVRKRTLSQEQEQIKRETLYIAETEKQLATAKDQLKVHELKKTKVPAALHQKIEMAESSLKESRKAIKEREEQIVQINIKFDETIKRFRDLTAGVAPTTPATAAAPSK